MLNHLLCFKSSLSHANVDRIVIIVVRADQTFFAFTVIITVSLMYSTGFLHGTTFHVFLRYGAILKYMRVKKRLSKVQIRQYFVTLFYVDEMHFDNCLAFFIFSLWSFIDVLQKKSWKSYGLELTSVIYKCYSWSDNFE